MEGLAGGVEEEVGVEVEAALGDDVGFEGADGAGGGVAGVDGGSLAGGFAVAFILRKAAWGMTHSPRISKDWGSRRL
jgi:hypothetical protein